MTGWHWLFLAVTAAVCYAGGWCRHAQRHMDELDVWRQAERGWRARAEAAEAKLRTQRLAPVLPLTCARSAGEKDRGLYLVRGGR